MEIRNQLRGLLNFWVIAGALAIAFLLLIAAIGLLLWTRPEPAPASLGTAILHVIRAPTGTPPPTATPPVTATQPHSGGITISSYVQVTGTSGEGLRLRAAPGLDKQVLNLGAEAEVFQVREGPTEADGYTWWYLVSPQDEVRRGWAVADYLQPAVSQ